MPVDRRRIAVLPPTAPVIEEARLPIIERARPRNANVRSLRPATREDISAESSIRTSLWKRVRCTTTPRHKHACKFSPFTCGLKLILTKVQTSSIRCIRENHVGFSREFHKERKKREEERKKAITNLAKKPKGVHQTTEQRNYQLKVREMRNKSKGHSGDGNESDSGGEMQGNEKDRQPRLNNLTPDYDLKLFMEAQAQASEKIVSIRFHVCVVDVELCDRRLEIIYYTR